MKIGCDIGGVIKQLTSDDEIPNAIKSINELAKSHEVIFISKCGDSFKKRTEDWLESKKLHMKIIFCKDYDDKVKIATLLGITVMIDDKLQVLRTFPDNITKIWLCDDQKRIAGTRKHQPELLETIKLANTWDDIMLILVRQLDQK